MDRQRAIDVFNEYVSHYDSENPMIRDKAAHTFRVAEAAEQIARNIPCPELADFAWFLGLLHDIGRFEQVRRYGTFADAQSVDHAELGADILFGDGLIDRFPTKDLPDGWRGTAETAVRLHNKLTLPDTWPGEEGRRTERLCRILRDADKVDIFRVITELPLERRAGSSLSMIETSDTISPGVMTCVMEHRCVPRAERHSALDIRVSHCCMAFELEFPISREMAARQGYLLEILEMRDMDGQKLKNPVQQEQMHIVQEEIEKAWGMPLCQERRADRNEICNC